MHFSKQKHHYESISTLILSFLLLGITSNSFSQTCGTGGTFTAGSTNDFSGNAQGFSGDFTYVTTAGGQLESSPVSSGLTKTLTASTFFQPANATTISFGFDLGGSANVTSYTVVALYTGSNGQIQSVPVCSGGAITKGQNLNFFAPAPSQIRGKAFKLQITFTISGSQNQIINIDNFRTSALSSTIVLPVKFSSFTIKQTSTGASLSWNIEAEENVKAYEVEKSADGRNFSNIGSVSATGSRAYGFSDTRIQDGASYYRIKSLEADGRATYSAVLLFKNGRSAIVFKAFPSVTSGKITLQHEGATASSKIAVALTDGRVVKTIIPAVGTQQTIIDLSSVQSGVYFVRYNSGNGSVETAKIIKQ